MNTFLINQVVNVIIATLPDDAVKKVLDVFLDTIEDAVQKSETKIDDAIVLLLCNKIREQLDIPDND